MTTVVEEPPTRLVSFPIDMRGLPAVHPEERVEAFQQWNFLVGRLQWQGEYDRTRHPDWLVGRARVEWEPVWRLVVEPMSTRAGRVVRQMVEEGLPLAVTPIWAWTAVTNKFLILGMSVGPSKVAEAVPENVQDARIEVEALDEANLIPWAKFFR